MKLTTTSDNKNLLYVKPIAFPHGFKIISYLIILTGASLLASGSWFGICFVLPGIFVAFYKEGVIFDLQKHTMCNYISIGPYRKFSKSKELKNYKYLSIVRVGVITNSAFYRAGKFNGSTSLKYKLTMIKDRKTYFKVTTDEYFKVFSLGKKIATHFGLGLVDYSKRYANWVIQPPIQDEKSN